MKYCKEFHHFSSSTYTLDQQLNYYLRDHPDVIVISMCCYESPSAGFERMYVVFESPE